MLEPSDRQVYWEPLSPPPGYELDLAVATTYSLDLQALIMAAVPMAFGALTFEKDGLPDEVPALASLQRVARRTTVFCQQAQIAPPGKYSRLFSLLEPVVAEVRAPRGGVFHPKMWLTRYTAEGSDPRYRLVVLSRNLTLDRSWDAMFVADGEGGHSARNYREPLMDFVRGLPDLCVEPLDAHRRNAIEELADELPRVRFDRPHGVRRRRHRPIGVAGYDDLYTGWADRRMVISPFLADRTVGELLGDVDEGILISREDSLDRLNQETLDSLDHCRIFYWLDDVADEPSDEETAEPPPGHEPDAGEGLRGLHAKLIVSERGKHARVLIGSANATDAAFGNHNVEYCIQLRGYVDELGIDCILPPEEDGDDRRDASLRNMLLAYERPDDFVPPIDPPEEKKLRTLRDHLAALDLGLAIYQAGDSAWDLSIEANQPAEAPPAGATVRCRPISREQEVNLRDASCLWRGEPVVFAGVSLETLTTFILFEIAIGRQRKRLVMNLPVREGTMPDQRQDRLIARMIADSDGFLRYLLMLLWNEDDVELDSLGMTPWIVGPPESGGSRTETLPLLEELVRTFSRNPERLDDIEDLIRRLRTTEEGKKIVPEEFLQLWEAFEAARGEADA
jgi:hypothetical protein